jgi:hypothetical protein
MTFEQFSFFIPNEVGNDAVIGDCGKHPDFVEAKKR